MSAPQFAVRVPEGAVYGPYDTHAEALALAARVYGASAVELRPSSALQLSQASTFEVGCTYRSFGRPRGGGAPMTVARRSAKTLWTEAGERFAVELSDGVEATKAGSDDWWVAASPEGQRPASAPRAIDEPMAHWAYRTRGHMHLSPMDGPAGFPELKGQHRVIREMPGMPTRSIFAWPSVFVAVGNRHDPCPACGKFLLPHWDKAGDRRQCSGCGYSESRAAA